MGRTGCTGFLNRDSAEIHVLYSNLSNPDFTYIPPLVSFGLGKVSDGTRYENDITGYGSGA